VHPYRITFLVGQRVLSWTRHYETPADAEIDAPVVVTTAYPTARNIIVAAMEV
jgi:hypothetical protein